MCRNRQWQLLESCEFAVLSFSFVSRDLLVMVLTVVRSPGLPALRVMVTGCVESPPLHVMVYVCPAVTAVGTEVKEIPLWARTADTKVATARDTLKNMLMWRRF